MAVHVRQGLEKRYEGGTGWVERLVWARQDALDGKANESPTGCTEKCACQEQTRVLNGLTL